MPLFLFLFHLPLKMPDGAVKSLVRNAVQWLSGSRMQRGQFCDACRSMFKSDGTIGDLKAIKYVDLFSRDIRTLEPQNCHICAIINYYVSHDEGYLEMQARSTAAPARHDMSVILVTGSYDHDIRFWEAWSGICSRTIARTGESGVRIESCSSVWCECARSHIVPSPTYSK